MEALYAAKRLIEDSLCEELNLTMVQVPLIVDRESGVNDYLDRDGSRTPVSFHISNDRDLHPIDAEVVQAATKWKRMALREFDMEPGEGLLTDMRAVRKDYFLDHDHSAYVDQWDWERAITDEDRTLEYLTATVRSIWRVITEADSFLRERWPALGEATRAAAGRADLRARGGHPRGVPRPAAQAAGDRVSSRIIRRSSSTGSAGRLLTATRTSCAQPTTTTGRRRRSRPTGARCTA